MVYHHREDGKAAQEVESRVTGAFAPIDQPARKSR
jgi:hypothetical protein